MTTTTPDNARTTTNPTLDGVFYRPDRAGRAHLLHEDDGSIVTRIRGVDAYDARSGRGVAHEHPEGIVLASEAEARALGLDTDGQTTDDE